MKHLIGFGLIAYLLVFALPVLAQTATPTPHVFENGYFEFENEISYMTYTGTWSTVAFGGGLTYRATSASGSSVSFYAQGKYVLVYRALDPSFWGSNLDACVSSSCVGYSSYHTAFAIRPFVIVLPDSNNAYQVSLTETVNYAYIDSFMVLPDAALVLPTPTPIVFPPSPTPVNTPVDTATPQPTTTPIGIVWSVDPAARYGMVDGQITAQEYTLGAGDYITIALLVIVVLTGLVQIGVSLWKD